MIKREAMTKLSYFCDTSKCDNVFHTFERARAAERGWTEVHHEIKGEGAWDGYYILHFCPRHELKDWL